jgi:periplasmic divalent cation tolerance protein
MDSEYVIVFVTAPTCDDGHAIARALVREKLAACVNILPGIRSIYTWEGEVCEDEEVLLIIKTRAKNFEDLSALVKEVHPYDVPEVIAMSLIAGAPDYLNWIDQVTQAKQVK